MVWRRCLRRGLTALVNTGDDFELFGLRICPDVDTVCYTLAQLANPASGWGRKDETWNAYDAIAALGGPTWFRLGDRDLGTHLERTRRLLAGEKLSAVIRAFCEQWQITSQVLPMSDEPVSTYIVTAEGARMPFQEYFVKLACAPVVQGFEFRGSERTMPAPGVLAAIGGADFVVICPSNPWVSIAPILSIAGIKEAVATKKVVAVRPLLGGRLSKARRPRCIPNWASNLRRAPLLGSTVNCSTALCWIAWMLSKRRRSLPGALLPGDPNRHE